MNKTTLAMLLSSALLSACGGGGGGGSSNLNGDSGNDPLLSRQWHLQNTGQEGALAGTDVNVTGVWQQGNEGSGVTVAVVDDGVEINHEDLRANIVPGQSLNMVSNGKAADDPSPTTYDDDHGTAVAGLIAAARNQVGGRGVAPAAKLIGANLLQATSSDNNDAAALLHGKAIVAVSNNSWGNNDGDNELGYAGPLFDAAVAEGATSGRAGKGIVYLFAAGNGAVKQRADGSLLPTGQRSGYDKYNNTPYALNIAAVEANGQAASYSEPGANVLVAAPSDSFDVNLPWLYTTAISGKYLNQLYMGQPWLFPNYRFDFGGTSGATPIASGVVALMLNANPALSWRDVRWILASTARPVSGASESGSAAVGAGVYSHKSGFGLIDAQAAVNMARSHTPLAAMKTCTLSLVANGNSLSPAADGSLSVSVASGSCGISQLESADLNLDLDAGASQVGITLRSPLGRNSTLATPHSCYSDLLTYTCSVPYRDWRFHSVRHLGENPSGQWTLRITGLQSGEALGETTLVLRGV